MPMTPGQFQIPAQDLIVTWADPDTTEPREDRSHIDAITITGTLPAGAEDMDPFIGATHLEITQDVSGAQAPLAAGDSVTRIVNATIEGTSPMFIPQLVQTPQIEGISTYPSEPVLSETSERGITSGTRVEHLTYVAQSGGNGAAPAISVDWFNLDTGQIETATAAEVSLIVDAPKSRSWSEFSLRRLIWGLAIGLSTLGFLWLVWTPLSTRWQHHRARRAAKYLNSATYARDRALLAVQRRVLNDCLDALELWAERTAGRNPQQDPSITDALAQIGSTRYGPSPSQVEETSAWVRLEKAIRNFRETSEKRAGLPALPPLNPT
jgi:hypothetical protein